MDPSTVELILQMHKSVEEQLRIEEKRKWGSGVRFGRFTKNDKKGKVKGLQQKKIFF